jgi:hypothetical protein
MKVTSRVLVMGLLMVAPACGGGAGESGSGQTGGAGGNGSGSGSSSSGSSGSGAGAPSCKVTRFGDAHDVGLPPAGGNADKVAFRTLSGDAFLPKDAYHAWSVVDMDGDGKPDLVRTGISTDATVGNARWLVHENQGNGFGPAQDFALPAAGGSADKVAFRTLSGDAFLPKDAYHAWAVVDMDGDGKPDLVRTGISTDATVGNTRWLVHKNEGNGFGPAQDFALPAAGGSADKVAFRTLSGDAFLPKDAYHAWAVVDMDGDGKPDLVRTGISTDTTVGNARWLVHKNEGNGFGPAQDFALPAAGGSADKVAFRTLSGDAFLPKDAYHAWAVVDMDGDHKPDLVRTGISTDTTVGNARWLVHKNQGNGFGAGEDFALPAAGGDADKVAFRTLGGDAFLPKEAYHAWSVVDISGDGKPDLVRTGISTDTTVGNARWLVHANEGNGFGSAVEFALPPVGGDADKVAFRTLSGDAFLPNEAYHAWSTVDLDGDGALDLVHTGISTDTSVGNARWVVYGGVCAP